MQQVGAKPERKKPQSVFMYPEVWYGLEKALEKEAARLRIDHPSAARDVRYIEALAARYSPHPVKSVLEVACGSAPHGRVMAKKGYQVVGYDYSEPMIRYATKLARKEGAPIKLYKRDSEDFTLPEEPFDIAMVLAMTQPCGYHARNGFEYNDAMVRHLKCVAAVLKPGALYVQDWGYMLDEFVPERVVKLKKVDDRGIPIPQALVRRRLYHAPTDIYGNVHFFIQRCDVSFKDGRTLQTLDRWRQPWLYPFVYHRALTELSGCFRYIGCFEFGQTEPGLTGRFGRGIWVVTQRL
jgi:SAM-dependent methyltransferase